MKKNSFLTKMKFPFLLFLLGLFFLAAGCRKYDPKGYKAGTGQPIIESVHTWSKTDTSVVERTIISYDDEGNLVQSVKSKTNQPVAFDSVTNEGTLRGYYMIYGQNLGSTTEITFNGEAAYFNNGLMTDHSILVQVPRNTPYFGEKATGKLVVTTLYGSVTYDFEILPPPPTIETLSNFNFSEGSEIELKGNGFIGVTAIKFAGTEALENFKGKDIDNLDGIDLNIEDQSDSTLLVKFPATDISMGSIVFVYDGETGESIGVDENELVNLDLAYPFFTDNFNPPWVTESWSGKAERVTDVARTGDASFKAVFEDGGWKLEGFKEGNLDYDEEFKYFSFWARGGVKDEMMYIETNASSAGFGQNEINGYNLPANVWTYFKIPMSSLDFWSPGDQLQSLAFFMKGEAGEDQIVYFDDVILIK